MFLFMHSKYSKQNVYSILIQVRIGLTATRLIYGLIDKYHQEVITVSQTSSTLLDVPSGICTYVVWPTLCLILFHLTQFKFNELTLGLTTVKTYHNSNCYRNGQGLTRCWIVTFVTQTLRIRGWYIIYPKQQVRFCILLICPYREGNLN